MLGTRRILSAAVLGLGFLAAAASARAGQILFQHAYEPFSSGSWCTPCALPHRMFDVFDLASRSTITSIEAQLYISTPGPIEYSIWTADRSTQLFVQTFDLADLTSIPLPGNSDNVVASMNGLELAAGSYALSIFGLDTANGSVLGWVGSPLAAIVHGRSYHQTLPNPGGGGTGRDMAFRIVGDLKADDGTAVPEPGALALTGMGLSALWVASFLRRFRRSREIRAALIST